MTGVQSVQSVQIRGRTGRSALSMVAGVWCIMAVATAGAAGGEGGVPPPPLPEAGVMTVKWEPVPVVRQFTGRVQAVRTAQVRARVDGIVQQRLFVEGSSVRAGERLFQIDARTLEAGVAAAQAALLRAQADRDLALQTADRHRQLLPERGVSPHDHDLAIARHKQAEADVAVMAAALKKAQIELEYATVTAPISGRIGRARVTEGALVSRSEATWLATIETMDPIHVDFSQPTVDRLQPPGRVTAAGGDSRPVELVLEDGSRYAHPGRILFTEMAVHRDSSTVLTRAEVPNPDQRLLPGMFVRVRVIDGMLPQAARVPQRAMQMTPQGGATVMVVAADGVVSVRPVQIGEMDGASWVVREGLQEGELVLVDGLQKVRPGGRVKPVPLAQ